MKPFVRSVSIILLSIASACAATPTSPVQTGPVSLTAQIDRATLAPGATAVVTFRLANASSDAVTLDFGSSCQVVPYIAKRPDNDVVYPPGGGWGCLTVITHMTLAPHSVTVTELRVRAGETAQGIVGLQAGEYVFFARLDDSVFKLESERVSLTVQ